MVHRQISRGDQENGVSFPLDGAAQPVREAGEDPAAITPDAANYSAIGPFLPPPVRAFAAGCARGGILPDAPRPVSLTGRS